MKQRITDIKRFASTNTYHLAEEINKYLKNLRDVIIKTEMQIYDENVLRITFYTGETNKEVPRCQRVVIFSGLDSNQLVIQTDNKVKNFIKENEVTDVLTCVSKKGKEIINTAVIFYMDYSGK